jgi:hypothetical protein
MDQLLDAFLDLGPTVAPKRIAEATHEAIRTTRRRRAWWPGRRLPVMDNFARIAIAAVAVIAGAILGITLLPGLNIGNPSQTPSPTPTSTTALLPCGESSADPSASALPDGLTWSPERATQDWPGALRAEPSGCAPVVVDAQVVAEAQGWTKKLFSDPQWDVSSEAFAWVDIVEGEFREGGCYSGVCVFFELAANVPRPIPDPRDAWIAYGIVVDATGDGRPDHRYGIDNAPGGDDLRIWQAEIATGRTEVSACCQTGDMDVSFPRPGDLAPPQASFDVPWRSLSPFRFYLWASVISGGEIVSTDYAPDFGWLEWAEEDE